MLYTMFFLLSTSFYRYKQGYKVIVVLNLGKMPGKQYTNKEIIERSDRIEKKFSASSNVTITYGIYVIGIGLIVIGFSMLSLNFVSPIEAISIVITGVIMIGIVFFYLIYEVFRSQK